MEAEYGGLSLPGYLKAHKSLQLLIPYPLLVALFQPPFFSSASAKGKGRAENSGRKLEDLLIPMEHMALWHDWALEELVDNLSIPARTASQYRRAGLIVRLSLRRHLVLLALREEGVEAAREMSRKWLEEGTWGGLGKKGRRYVSDVEEGMRRLFDWIDRTEGLAAMRRLEEEEEEETELEMMLNGWVELVNRDMASVQRHHAATLHPEQLKSEEEDLKFEEEAALSPPPPIDDGPNQDDDEGLTGELRRSLPPPSSPPLALPLQHQKPSQPKSSPVPPSDSPIPPTNASSRSISPPLDILAGVSLSSPLLPHSPLPPSSPPLQPQPPHNQTPPVSQSPHPPPPPKLQQRKKRTKAASLVIDGKQFAILGSVPSFLHPPLPNEFPITKPKQPTRFSLPASDTPERFSDLATRIASPKQREGMDHERGKGRISEEELREQLIEGAERERKRVVATSQFEGLGESQAQRMEVDEEGDQFFDASEDELDAVDATAVANLSDVEREASQPYDESELRYLNDFIVQDVSGTQMRMPDGKEF
ncbi:hypothetical protein BT69DRAFT_1351057 [Atractiella rhizophila]|nr:hypothetical protein BT69DRAFT_1351057 [Atractiella rhizophila]